MPSAQRVSSWPSRLPSGPEVRAHQWLCFPREQAAGGVCLSSPSCSPAAGYSYTFRYRHASQTKEGEGGVRLSEALEQILGAVSTLGDSSWSLATVFSFHTGLPAGIESPHPTQTGQQSNQASATGVCVPQQGQNNQFQPHPPQVSRISLSHTATPPPVPSEPVDWEEISPTSPNQNGEGRKAG